MDYKWPFFVGTGFLLIILAIAFFGDDPTPAQFMIYRIVIALAGAGFAVALSGTLSVNFPLFQRGESRLLQPSRSLLSSTSLRLPVWQ